LLEAPAVLAADAAGKGAFHLGERVGRLRRRERVVEALARARRVAEWMLGQEPADQEAHEGDAGRGHEDRPQRLYVGVLVGEPGGGR
jgi:hypothetical protein